MNDFLVVDTLPKLKDLADRWKEREFALDTEFTDLSYYKQDLIGISLYSDRHDIPAVFIQFNFKDTYTQKEKNPDGGRAKIDVEYVYEKTDAIDKQEALPYLKKIIDGADCVTANGKVEIKALHKYGISINIKDDVNLMNHLLDVSSKSDLKTAGRKYLKIDMKSYEETVGMKVGNINWNKVDWEAYAEYGAKDSWVTWKLREVFRKQVEEDEPLLHCYEKLELPLIPKVAESEIAGVYIDKSVLQEMSERIAKDIKRSEEAIFNEVGVEFNLGSPKQLAEILFDRLGLPVISETASGGRSTGEDAMKELAFMGYDIAEKILDYRRLSKLQTTYIDKIPDMVDGDGRLRGSFNQQGTATGRFSSSNPNLQNIVNDKIYPVKRAFVAKKGYSLLVFDWCIAEGSEVLTKQGAKPIEMCVAGDEVLQEDGTYRKILSVPYRGEKRVVRLTTSCGYDIVATDEHRFRVIDINGEYVWKKIKDIDVNNDFIAIQPTTSRPEGARLELPEVSYTHYNNKELKNTPKYLDEDLAFFMGYISGDGSLSASGRTISWVVNEKDTELAKYLEDLVFKLFGEKPKYVGIHNGAYQYYFNSIPLLNWMRLIGVSKDNVPEMLMFSDLSVVKSWLKGYFEADGYGGRRISICSSREGIIKQAQKLLLQIGIYSKYKKQKNGEFIKHLLTIPTNFTGVFLEEVGFFSERKILNTHNKAGNFGRSPVYGGHPNLKGKIYFKDTYGLRYYLNNTKFRGGVVSRKVAEKVKQIDEEEYNRLGLYKILEWGQVYDKVESIEDYGVVPTYDLEVEDTHSFIVNGFVSHNSTIEIRIMAHESKDPVMTKILKEYRDVHQETADNISAQTGLHLSRSIGKTLNFAILYGMGADALAYTLNKSMRGEVKKGTMTQEEYEVSQIDQRTAQKMIDGFYSAYAGFTEWGKLEVHNTKKTGWVYTLGGRRRPVPELQNKKTYNAGVRKCVNTIIQGGAGDLMKLAIIKLSNMYKEKGYDATTLLYVHDEIVIEVRNDQAEKCKEDVRWLMENIFPACDVPILCEGDIYKSWDGLKGGETHNSIGQSSNSLFNFLKFNKLIFK